MNRTLFHWIGYAAPICLLPYLLTLPASALRERFPVLFFVVVVLGLIGFVAGILWLMFFIEYRGVWFGKEDRGRPQKFEESDLPVLRETGLRLLKRLSPVTLYCWDMVLRPVILPDGRRVFNIRYDFVSAVTERFALEERFPSIALERGKKYTFHFRVSLDKGEGLEFFEFDPAKRLQLSSPALKKVSSLDLRNSPALQQVLESMFAGRSYDWQLVSMEYHAEKKPYLSAAVVVFSPTVAEFAAGSDSIRIAGEKRECFRFRLNPDLSYGGHLRKESLFRRIFSA